MKTKEIITSVLNSPRNRIEFIDSDKFNLSRDNNIFRDFSCFIEGNNLGYFVFTNKHGVTENEYGIVVPYIRNYFFDISINSELHQNFENISDEVFSKSFLMNTGEKIHALVTFHVNFEATIFYFSSPIISSLGTFEIKNRVRVKYQFVFRFNLSVIKFSIYNYIKMVMSVILHGVHDSVNKKDFHTIRQKIIRSRRINTFFKGINKFISYKMSIINNDFKSIIRNASIPDGDDPIVSVKHALKSRIEWINLSLDELTYLSDNISEFYDVIHQKLDATNIKTVKDVYRKILSVDAPRDPRFVFNRKIIDKNSLSEVINNIIISKTIDRLTKKL